MDGDQFSSSDGGVGDIFVKKLEIDEHDGMSHHFNTFTNAFISDFNSTAQETIFEPRYAFGEYALEEDPTLPIASRRPIKDFHDWSMRVDIGQQDDVECVRALKEKLIEMVRACEKWEHVLERQNPRHMQNINRAYLTHGPNLQRRALEMIPKEQLIQMAKTNPYKLKTILQKADASLKCTMNCRVFRRCADWHAKPRALPPRDRKKGDDDIPVAKQHV